MEHTVYLAAKDFIETVRPRAPKKKNKTTTNKTTTKNGTASVEDADDDDEGSDDDEDWIADWCQLEENLDELIADDEPVDFAAGDVLGKTLGLVNQVRFAFLLLVPH